MSQDREAIERWLKQEPRVFPNEDRASMMETEPMHDEDDNDVFVRGGTEHAILYTGLDVATLRARGDYLAGRITVEEFEDEIERLLRKRQRLAGT